MARWREREPVEIPPWVFESTPEADAWLDALHERDPERFYEAFVTIISTPTITHPRPT